MVIDVKNDGGLLSYTSSIPFVQQMRSDHNPSIRDIHALLGLLHKKHIYAIRRIVTFKDPHLARQKPEWAIHKKDGGLWQDIKGTLWTDPYQRDVWDYNIAIAKEAAALGFDEIQFDYVRFPDNGSRVNQGVGFANKHHLSKEKTIVQFFHRACPENHRSGSYLSADVFGLITSSTTDMGVGQVWEQVTREVDVISPMTYPSHYSSGMYGTRQPDSTPDEAIRHTMMDAKLRNVQVVQSVSSLSVPAAAMLTTKPAEIRPWLQNFTATWVPSYRVYGIQEVRQ
ncbi:hypothetical protein BVG16_28050 [Paenibacillus selenitireducens]|uniref:DUF4015 domain-containing protein n=1 Tax=Paenibacillus selenitireducens TaxID=1324314 RepID=A0A1T2X0U2_9BACL|nr:putative glycoside hydrolase [Paenibacillus selenitireducens]OPA73487.1 hypothetical protein BVG16_28050 [Paenibacillus selenitireducens]